jgi:membrane peptidoglycan carboxypeptidase
MFKRLLRWGAWCLLIATLAVWAFSYGLGIWTINWDNPAPFLEGDVDTIDYVDGKLVANFKQHRIEYISVDKMPDHLVKAFVAVEDRRFYQHWGVDFRGVARALRANLHSGEIAEGGSTITQQLARNLFLNLEQTMERKIAEMSIALQLERKYDKDEILEMYINQVNFGAGNWGVARAAEAYFNKDVSELSIGEGALLAGLVQAPNAYAPVKSWDKAIARQRIVLGRMAELGYITPEQATAEVYQVDSP